MNQRNETDPGIAEAKITYTNSADANAYSQGNTMAEDIYLKNSAVDEPIVGLSEGQPDGQTTGVGAQSRDFGDLIGNGSPEDGLVGVDQTQKPCADEGRATMSTKADRPRNNSIMIGLGVALLAVYAALDIFANSYDNDIWFILATGEYIVNNGIPYENPFSVFEGLNTVIQQWVICVLSYGIYSNFGFAGLGLWVTFIYALVVISMYKVGRIVRGDRYGGEWLVLLALLVSIPMASYMTVRPHMYTMIAFLWVIGFCELYRRSGNVKWLIPLPFITLLHINFHAAMAPFDLVIILCYLIPNFLAPIHRKGKLCGLACSEWSYSRLPLLIAFLACALSMLVNPYGIEGALYLVNSYGAAAYRNYISEMGTLAPAANYKFALYVIVLFLFAVALGRSGPKKINLPLTLLVLGTAYLGFTQVRNYWLAPLFAFLYLSWISRGHRIKFISGFSQGKVVGACLAIVGIVISGMLIAFKIPDFEKLPPNAAATPVAAMDYLDEIGADKETTRVFDFFNPGGYIEYRGYKVGMDPRPELWNSAITKQDFDYYYEYVDMHSGDIYFDDYISKYGFNVFIVPEDDGAVDLLKDQERFMEISNGEGYRAFIERDAYETITGKDISTAPQVHRAPVKSS